VKKIKHRYWVYATDDAQIDSLRTRWKIVRVLPTRREAWAEARRQLVNRRFVRVTEERIFKGAD
jgi:hypothetical protein